MSLLNAITQGVAAAFNVVDSLLKSVTITHYTGLPVRNEADGSYTRPSTSVNCKVAITNFSRYENADIVVGDLKMIAKQADTPLDVGDIVLLDGRTYEVVNPNADPAQVTWQSQIRLKKITT